MLFIFFCYFSYSIGFYFILSNAYNKLVNTKDYILNNSILVDSLYKNALSIKFMMLQNKTDSQFTTYLEQNSTEEFVKYSIINTIGLEEEEIKNIHNNEMIKQYFDEYSAQITDCNTNIDLFKDQIITMIKETNSDVIPFLKDICKNSDLMNKHVDNFIVNIIYDTLSLLNKYQSEHGNYDKIKSFNNDKGMLYDLNTNILVIYRPIQVFITAFINVSIVDSANNEFILYSIIFLVINIIVEILLVYVIDKLVVKRSSLINTQYTTVIECLKV
jgi:hypothetical protein